MSDQTLAYSLQGKVGAPTFIFLHGFLGSSSDWQSVIAQLPQFCCIALDLPGHGRSRHIQADDFATVCDLIARTLAQCLPSGAPSYLVGYSLGARLAMLLLAQDFLQQFTFPQGSLCGVLLEGGHFGLQSASERTARWDSDLAWAARFSREPLERVLQDWYSQPVFASLTAFERAQYCQRRLNNDGAELAKTLLATSLAKQPDLRGALTRSALSLYYLCGEKDLKFQLEAKNFGLQNKIILNAGHNAHVDAPAAFARELMLIALHSSTICID
ncbi:MAG: 2-succinyl-6-hydroxy-2,4-cyclohexadiene-1-carboxylate synthase, partial [Enterovibrio sp.]